MIKHQLFILVYFALMAPYTLAMPTTTFDDIHGAAVIMHFPSTRPAPVIPAPALPKSVIKALNVIRTAEGEVTIVPTEHAMYKLAYTRGTNPRKEIRISGKDIVAKLLESEGKAKLKRQILTVHSITDESSTPED